MKAALILAQSADLATTLLMMAWVGVGAEVNPLLRAVWDGAGPLGVSAIKAGAVGLVLWVRSPLALGFGIGLGALAAALNGAMLMWALAA